MSWASRNVPLSRRSRDRATGLALSYDEPPGAPKCVLQSSPFRTLATDTTREPSPAISVCRTGSEGISPEGGGRDGEWHRSLRVIGPGFSGLAGEAKLDALGVGHDPA